MKISKYVAFALPILVFASCASEDPQPDPGVAVTGGALTGSCKWTQVSSPNVGASDNVLAAVAGEATNNVWAVGSLVPDSNPDITTTLVNHFNGSKWSVVASPNVGSEANSLNGVAAKGGKAWAVGFYIDAQFVTQSLIEEWDGHRWNVVSHPQPGTSNMLNGVSASAANDVWAVGSKTDAAGNFSTLVEHFDGTAWSVVTSPDPGSVANIFYSVFARSNSDVWAVGERSDGAAPDSALVRHWTGSSWMVVTAPSDGSLSTNLFSTSGTTDSANMWAVGDAHSNLRGSRLLIEEGSATADWKVATAASVGPGDNHLYGVAFSNANLGWAVGSEMDSAGAMETIVLSGGPGGWSHVSSPSPGLANGDSVFGGVASIGGTVVWAVGAYDGVNAVQTMIQRCQ